VSDSVFMRVRVCVCVRVRVCRVSCACVLDRACVHVREHGRARTVCVLACVHALPAAVGNFRRRSKLPKASGNFRRLPETFGNFRRLPETSEGLRKLPETSGNFRRRKRPHRTALKCTGSNQRSRCDRWIRFRRGAPTSALSETSEGVRKLPTASGNFHRRRAASPKPRIGLGEAEYDRLRQGSFEL
jgi:hypothetical protein